jgi:hypothetical protein
MNTIPPWSTYNVDKWRLDLEPRGASGPTLKPAPSNEPNDLRPNTNQEDSEPNDPEPIWLAEEEGDYSDRGPKHIYDHSIASGHRSKHKWVQVAAGAFRQ